MRNLIVCIVVLGSLPLATVSTLAQNREQSAQPEIIPKGDHFGESLKEFRSRHLGARCHRRPGEESEDRKKVAWLVWVDCGLERRVTLPTFERVPTTAGGETLLQDGTIRLLGMFATFHDKKLVEIGYTLDAPSIEKLLPAMYGFGEPQSLSTKDGNFQSATWVVRQVAATIEVVSLPPVTADGQFLRVGKGTPTRAVQMRTRLIEKGEPTSGY